MTATALKTITARVAVFLCLVFVLASCARLQPHDMPMKKIMVVVTEDVAPRQADAVVTDTFCLISIHPDHYTHSCLGHELRHCIEGRWHGDDVVYC